MNRRGVAAKGRARRELRQTLICGRSVPRTGITYNLRPLSSSAAYIYMCVCLYIYIYRTLWSALSGSFERYVRARESLAEEATLSRARAGTPSPLELWLGRL